MKNRLMLHKDLLLMVAMVSGACLVLSSCSVYSETKFTENKAEIRHEIHTEKMAVSDMDEAAARAVASHYSRHGSGTAAVVVTYDPKAKDMTAMGATEEAARIGSTMRRYGVRDIDTRIMPAQGDAAGLVLVSYNSYTAHAPKDCGLMAGIENSDVRYDKDYEFGCSMETMFARQVARPKDLAGQDMTDLDMDGRGLSNVVEAYRMGETNPELGSESTTD